MGDNLVRQALPESRFTAPTSLCPFPERWTSVDEQSTECEVGELLYGLVRALQPEGVLETGSNVGETSVLLLRALEANEHGALYTLEWNAELAATARARLTATWSKTPFSVIHADSLTWQPPEGLQIDFAFFDSIFPNRVPEFRRYRPWMRPGTIVAFHDTAPGHGASRYPGSDIRSTIARELHSAIRLINLPTPRGITLGEVIE